MPEYKNDSKKLEKVLKERIDQIFKKTEESDNQLAIKVSKMKPPYDYSSKYINRIRNKGGIDQFLMKYVLFRIFEDMFDVSIFSGLVETEKEIENSTDKMKDQNPLEIIGSMEKELAALKKFYIE